MTKTAISISAIAATIAADEALRDGFAEVHCGHRDNKLTAREVINAAITVSICDRTRPQAWAERVREVVEIDDESPELHVDLGKVKALSALCGKVYKEAYRTHTRQATMASLGMDDPYANDAGKHLRPLLEAICATVRRQAESLDGRRAKAR